MAETIQSIARHMGIHELAEKLPQLTSLYDIRKLFVSFFSARNIRAMAYYQSPPLGAKDRQAIIPIGIHGIPEGWLEYYYERKLYRFDPIPRVAAASGAPFWFTDLSKRKDIKPDELRFLENLERREIFDGLVIPLFGPYGRNGYGCFDFDPNAEPISSSEVNTLHWAAQIGHLRTCELLNEFWTDPVKVSAREKQILGFIAVGRANPVIAADLGLSTNTIDTYVRRLFTKLEVSDRVSATLRGLALGLIN